MAGTLKRYSWVVIIAALCGPAAMAWDIETMDGSQIVESTTGASTPSSTLTAFWPDLGPATLAWFAVVAIIALTVRPKPLLLGRSLDGLMLAGTSLLLLLRGIAGSPVGTTHTWQWWAHLGLTAVAAYWLVRGISLLLRQRPVLHSGTVSNGTRVVLVAAGLALCVHQIASAPLSAGSRDGTVGGIHLADTGKLPYGDAALYESRSPLLYMLHAGPVRAWTPLLTPALDTQGESGPLEMTWDNYAQWIDGDWQESANLAAARIVNAGLFIGVLIGFFLIGRLLRSSSSGWTMVALLCLFPGTLECLSRPEIMLPTLLLTWSVVFALLPGVGGLLGTFCLVMAGLAWPWMWLGLPVMLAHFWRRGWHVVGSTLGLAGGVGVCLCMLANHVQPSLPRDNGALAMAGLQPIFEAQMTDDGHLAIDRRAIQDEALDSPATSRPLWRMLVNRETNTLDTADGLAIDWPNGLGGPDVAYRQIMATGAARTRLQESYRATLSDLPAARRLPIALRTVLEATWMPAVAQESRVTSAWTTWGGPAPMEQRWVQIRRIAKVVVALLVVWASLATFFGRRVRPRQLIGALMLTISGALLISEMGAVTNLVCLLPLVAALWAVGDPPERPGVKATNGVKLPPVARPKPATALAGKPGPDIEPPPRITLDEGPKPAP